MRSGSIRKKRIIFCFFIIIVCAFSLAVFVNVIRQPSLSRIIGFSDGWDVVVSGKEYTNVTVSRFKIPGKIKKGELIALRRDLPLNLSNGNALILPLSLSVISVDIDGAIVYGYGSKEYSEDEMVGSAVHIIRIPDDSRGKPISIVIRAGEDGAFTFLPWVAIDKVTWGFIDYINYSIYPTTISISVLMGGIIIIIIAAFLAMKGQSWERIYQTGMLIFNIGCWNLCETNAVQLFSMDYRWNTYARYIFGFLSILPALRILGSSRVEGAEKERRIQLAIIYFNQLMIFAAIVVTVVKKVHICNLRYFFQAMGFISIVITGLLELRKYKGKEIFRTIRFWENVFFYVFLVAEMIRYSINSRFNFESQILQHSLLLYGSLLLVLMMLGGYVYELYISYLQQAEKETLKKLVYTDSLTGLLNRTFCKERMEELDKGKKHYYMISFDVDDLKMINDSKGHPEGDRLLTAFADILHRCFSDIGNVIRPGGDEFLVISDDAKKYELEKRLVWLKDMERDAMRSLGIPINAAYGLAGSDEIPECTTEKVYNLADERMYNMKTGRKEKRKAGINVY